MIMTVIYKYYRNKEIKTLDYIILKRMHSFATYFSGNKIQDLNEEYFGWRALFAGWDRRTSACLWENPLVFKGCWIKAPPGTLGINTVVALVRNSEAIRCPATALIDSFKYSHNWRVLLWCGFILYINPYFPITVVPPL